MANLALSTQIPQIGDSSQQLLARMAAAQAIGRANDNQITVLPSAVRSTSSYIAIGLPQGVIGFIARLNITAVPGVDTVYLLWQDNFAQYVPLASGASANGGQHMIIMRNNYQIATNPAYSIVGSSTSGLTDAPMLGVVHSGAGSFTYSLTLRWLRS